MPLTAVKMLLGEQKYSDPLWRFVSSLPTKQIGAIHYRKKTGALLRALLYKFESL
jgi:hypothetical protein